MEILQRYANFIGTFSMPGSTHSKSLYSVFICMQKINFIIHFFFTILHFPRYVGEISTTMLGFIIDYLQEKLTSQNFSKNLKNPILGLFRALLSKLGQRRIFLEKRALPVFQSSNYLPLCQKSEKPKEPLLTKLLELHTKNQSI